jgi:hypothetical protein
MFAQARIAFKTCPHQFLRLHRVGYDPAGETGINDEASAATSNATFAYHSMQNIFPRDLFSLGYLANLDVVVRKLIFEQQACSDCILIASMRRINSTIDLEDIVLVTETAIRRDPIFHETPHQSPRDAMCSARQHALADISRIKSLS